MFENKNDWSKEVNSFSENHLEENNNFPDVEIKESRLKKFVIIFLFFLVSIGISLIFYKYQSIKNNYFPVNLSKQATSTNVSKLPDVVSDIVGSSTLVQNNEISSEKLTFGSFYKKQDFKYTSLGVHYDLPLNIKSDTVNYYDVSRALNLEQEIVDRLNSNGFAISKNSLTDSGDDFWSVYKKLLKLDVPIVVTDDFLLYYFQNNLKQIYKEIEKSAFYSNLWDVQDSFVAL